MTGAYLMLHVQEVHYSFPRKKCQPFFQRLVSLVHIPKIFVLQRILKVGFVTLPGAVAAECRKALEGNANVDISIYFNGSGEVSRGNRPRIIIRYGKKKFRCAVDAQSNVQSDTGPI